MKVLESVCCDPSLRCSSRVSFGNAGSLEEKCVDDLPRHDLHFASSAPENFLDLRSEAELAWVGVLLILTGRMTGIKAAAARAIDY